MSLQGEGDQAQSFNAATAKLFHLLGLGPAREAGWVIQPAGKAYHLPMATLGHWTKPGVMDKEYLFWDNASLMTQIGAAN